MGRGAKSIERVKKDGWIVEIEFAPRILERRFLSSELSVMTKQYHRKMLKSRERHCLERDLIEIKD